MGSDNGGGEPIGGDNMARVAPIRKVIYSCPYSPEEQERNREEFYRVIAKRIYEMMKADGVFDRGQRKEAAR